MISESLVGVAIGSGITVFVTWIGHYYGRKRDAERREIESLQRAYLLILNFERNPNLVDIANDLLMVSMLLPEKLHESCVKVVNSGADKDVVIDVLKELRHRARVLLKLA